MTMIPWDDGLSEMFCDPEFVKAYLQAAWDEEGAVGVVAAMKHLAEVGRCREIETASATIGG